MGLLDLRFKDIFLWLIFQSCLLLLTESQDCRSYRRQKGMCVSIKNCPPLLTVLQSPRRTVADIQRLQRLTCITEIEQNRPVVCCPVKEIYNEPPTSEADSSEEVILNEEHEDFSHHPNLRKLPSLEECSYSVVDALGDRVIGGKEATHGKYPWMARIGYRNKKTGLIDFYCAGTVINKRFILTAAHCTVGYESNYLLEQVRLGEYDSKSKVDCNEELGNLCSVPEDYAVVKTITHPSYNPTTKQNDISLIKLDKDVSFSSYFIRPICLPFFQEYNITVNQDTFRNGAKGIVAGWGRTMWTKLQGSRKLMDVKLPFVSNKRCNKIFRSKILIDSSQMCAGGIKGKDSCGGDSGGPLMIKLQTPNKISKLFQVGVVSFGQVQCGGGLPGVYVKISAHLKWILDNIS